MNFIITYAFRLSEWLLLNTNSANFQINHDEVNFQSNDDEVRLVLDQQALLDLYSASSLKQPSANRHVAPLRHIILVHNQPVFAISP
jgi:hypothetical protein